MKKRWTILVTSITVQAAFRVEHIFIDCCILHNRMLYYNGAADWRELTLLVPKKG
jgi:hypothetical protein